MTSSDYDALAWVINNCATSTMEQMVKATGLSQYKLDAMMRTFGIVKRDGVYAMVGKMVNMYIFCSVLQIPQYLAFAQRHGYKFDILTWHKTNAVPACGGKYMPDTEYIVFIKESGVPLYGTAATKCKYYVTPTNVKDKRKWGHPTIKPLNIVQNLIANSTQEGG